MLKLKVENIIIEENKIGGQGCRFYFTKNFACALKMSSLTVQAERFFGRTGKR